MVLVRFLLPPLHLELHALHAPHCDMRHGGRGQGARMHGFMSLAVPHFFSVPAIKVRRRVNCPHPAPILIGSWVRRQRRRVVVGGAAAWCGGVGQLGMAHRSDGPASSLRMFGHVHRAMCGGGCQFEVLEEHACT